MNSVISTVLFLISLTFFSCQKAVEPSNGAPVIEKIVQSHGTVGISRAVILTAIATDPDGDQLSFVWDAQEGSFNNGSIGQQVTWTAPGQIGSFIVNVSVSDGKATSNGSAQIHVSAVTTVLGNVWYTGTKVPISSVIVQIDTSSSSTTDESGFFKIDGVLPGAHTLTATKQSFSPYVAEINVQGDTLRHDVNTSSSTATATVSGTVRNVAGVAISGVQATMLNPDLTESQLTTTTDASGNYTLPAVPQGQRTFRFSHQLFNTATPLVFVFAANLTHNVALVSVPVSGPTGLVATAISPTKIRIAWSKVFVSTLVGYNIYRREATQTEFVKVNTFVLHKDTMQFLDTGLAPSTEYEYHVKCVNVDQMEGLPSTTLHSTMSLPNPPAQISGTQLSSSSIRFTWQKVVHPFIAGYNLYASSDGSTFIKLNSSLIHPDSVGLTLSGVSFSNNVYYGMRSVDLEGNEGQISKLLVEGFEGELPSTIWSLSGNPTWQVTESDAYSGLKSCTAYHDTSGGLSIFSITITAFQVKEVSFKYKVNNPYVMGFEYTDLSGTHLIGLFPDQGDAWKNYTATLQASTNTTIMWILQSYPGQFSLPVTHTAYVDDIVVR